ncbi:DUF4142 domain-containing protein [Caenimonas koreensis]|nr:DUF4142 domain-containing protein [Caenimonas koreensis]
MNYARYLLAAVVALASVCAMAQAALQPGESAPISPDSEPPARPAISRTPLFAPASAATSRRLSSDQLFERGFLKDAAASTRFESDAARMASAKSQSPQVRSFASALVDHHLALAPVLQHMLHARGMAAPMLADHQRKALNRLAKIEGRKFDQEFMSVVGLKSQQANVQLFERASAGARDPALKAWIDQTLPTVRASLAGAEDVLAPGAKARPVATAAARNP